jgi:hypothetical protein
MDKSLETFPCSMSGSTLFNVAYGLKCDSKDDPTLVRMDKMLTAVTQSTQPSFFLVVSVLFRCVHEKNYEFSNLLECVSGLEIPPFLDAWWFIQEVG